MLIHFNPLIQSDMLEKTLVLKIHENCLMSKDPSFAQLV